MDKKLIGKALKKASELFDDTPSEQALLAEYQACQRHNDSAGNQIWVSITIMITVNLAVLGLVLINLILTSGPAEGGGRLIIVLLISLLMIYILLLFQKWNIRTDFINKLNWERMRQIEEVMHMLKNWRVHGLDCKYDKKRKREYNTLPDYVKTHIDNLNYLKAKCSLTAKPDKYVSPTSTGLLRFNCILWVLISVWCGVCIIELLIYFFGNIRNFMIN